MKLLTSTHYQYTGLPMLAFARLCNAESKLVSQPNDLQSEPAAPEKY